MTPGCFQRSRREFSSPMFDLTELPKSQANNANNKEVALTREELATTTPPRLDVVKTFSPSPRIAYISAKVFLTAWVVAMMAKSIQNSSFPSFWLAYLTHWGWVATVAYFLSSLMTALYLAKNPPDASSVDKAGLIVKITWALFAISLPGEIIICILFWALEFDGTVRYVSMMLHGVGVLLLAIDGFVLNRIPLRMKQFLLYELFATLYLTWNIIHAFSGIGNPYKDNGEQDDDAIYASMKWKENTASAVILGVLVLFVANPIIFWFCRGVSRLFSMRLKEDGPMVVESGGDVEMAGGEENGGAFDDEEPMKPVEVY